MFVASSHFGAEGPVAERASPVIDWTSGLASQLLPLALHESDTNETEVRFCPRVVCSPELIGISSGPLWRSNDRRLGVDSGLWDNFGTVGQ